MVKFHFSSGALFQMVTYLFKLTYKSRRQAGPIR